MEETRSVKALLKEVIDLLERENVDTSTYELGASSLDTFINLLELLEFALKRGWNADDFIRLANVITALQQTKQ